MTLNKLIKNLVDLQLQGHGDKQVFACHSASGACDPVESARVSDYVGEADPFDLEKGEEYIDLYIGN